MEDQQASGDGMVMGFSTALWYEFPFARRATTNNPDSRAGAGQTGPDPLGWGVVVAWRKSGTAPSDVRTGARAAGSEAVGKLGETLVVANIEARLAMPAKRSA
jgi:hypothetical protein